MKKTILALAAVIFAASAAFAAEDFYSLEAKKINGEMLQFSELKGKKLMIVNTASYCGYTYQYAELQELYEKYGGSQFEIIGFPANNFNNQEPGSDEDIEKFCRENFGITFTMMSKISVVGDDMHPVYQWLTQKEKNGVRNSQVQWNFQKYLISEDGSFFQVLGTTISPLNVMITDWLDETVAVAENKADAEIIVFPNPAEDYIALNSKNIPAGKLTAAVLDIYGRQAAGSGGVESFDGINSVRINTAGLSSGVYFCVINTDRGVIVKRFVKK